MKFDVKSTTVEEEDDELLYFLHIIKKDQNQWPNKSFTRSGYEGKKLN